MQDQDHHEGTLGSLSRMFRRKCKPAPTLERKLDQALEALNERKKGLTAIMRTLDEVLEKVQAEGTKVDGLITLVKELKAQVAEQTSGILTPDQQAKVDAIFDEAAAAADKIDTAVSTTPNGSPAPTQ